MCRFWCRGGCRGRCRAGAELGAELGAEQVQTCRWTQVQRYRGTEEVQKCRDDSEMQMQGRRADVQRSSRC